MEVKVCYQSGKRFTAETRGHQIIVDQPRDNDGDDAGMTPPELFLSSLASCAGYYAAEYLKARNLPTDGLEIRLTGEKGDQPARIVSLDMDVKAPGLNKHHRDGILHAIEACLLTRTLHSAPRVQMHIAGTSSIETELLVAPVWANYADWFERCL